MAIINMVGGQPPPLLPIDELSDPDESASSNEQPEMSKSWSPWIRKPRWAIMEHSPLTDGGDGLHRHLSLFDLICVGVGGTVGSGIFVLCGLVAHTRAGPATFISWAITGCAACMSALCYAELAGRFPAAGSSYAYAYVTMGELPAVVSGACLTLEYLFSSGAVARNWGDKIVEYVKANLGDDAEDSLLLKVLQPWKTINPMGFFVSSLSVLMLLKGVKESKMVVNIFTILKVGLVMFMTIISFILTSPSNLTPLVPAEFGIKGIFSGASSLFFGYIGYDEICCMAEEAVDPTTNLPRAVVATLAITTVLYVLASIALTGMVPYGDINETSPFPNGFHYRGQEWAAQISAIGEIVVLPLVVMVGLMAQPRIQYAMAKDGLLPSIFAEVDSSGNLWCGIGIAGAIMVITATFVPFTYLNDLVSSGILVAFNITNGSLLILRHKSPEKRPNFLPKMLGLFNGSSLLVGLLLRLHGTVPRILSAIPCISMLVSGYMIYRCCPEDDDLNAVTLEPFPEENSENSGASETDGVGQFRAPFLPFLPLIGTFVNWYLIAHLEWFSLILLASYLSPAVAFYFFYGRKHSIGNTCGWESESSGYTLLEENQIT